MTNGLIAPHGGETEGDIHVNSQSSDAYQFGRWWH